MIVRESKLLVSKCSFYCAILYYFLMEKGKTKKTEKKIKTNNASKELSKPETTTMSHRIVNSEKSGPFANYHACVCVHARVCVNM